jgi:hypothetical protein
MQTKLLLAVAVVAIGCHGSGQLGSLDLAAAIPDGAASPVDESVPPLDLAIAPPDLQPPLAQSQFLDDWETLCIATLACQSGNPLSFCLSVVEGQPSAFAALRFGFPGSLLTCVARAGTDCSQIHACMNGGDPNYACAVDAGVSVSCAGGAASLCVGGYKRSYNCAAGALSCAPSALIGCNAGTCPVGSPGTCAGALVEACEAGHLEPIEDCSVLDNALCSTAGCQGTGPACANSRCDGSTVVACRGGNETRYDCSKDGLTCVSVGQYVGCGLDTACDPTRFAFQATCNGTVLTYCYLGRVKTLDCVAAGWKGCTTFSGSLGAGCAAQ